MWFGFRPTPPLRAAGLFTFTGGATMKKGLILPLPSIVVGTSEEEREKPVNEDQSSLCVFGGRESPPPHFAHIRTGHFVSFSSIYGLGTERSVEKRGAFYEGRGPLSPPPPPPSFSLPPPPFPFSSSSSLFPRQRSSNFDKMQNWLYYHTQGREKEVEGRRRREKGCSLFHTCCS